MINTKLKKEILLKMEEIKQKGCYVCGKTREYYNKEAKRAVCLECKLSYYSKCKLVKIYGGRVDCGSG